MSIKFRKKPIVIEAVCFDGSYESARAVRDWAGPDHGSVCFTGDGTLTVLTLEGVMRADAGDWIIKGVKGEFYPIKAEIFRETYDPAEDTP